MRPLPILPAVVVSILLTTTVAAQPQSDTTISWRSYSQTGTTAVEIYPGPPDDEETHTLVLRELAKNRGPTAVADLPYLADVIGRQLGIDPTAAYWVVYWGGFSFEGADPDADKALYLEATFNRTDDGDLGSPSWDVISETELREITDRRWRE